MHVAALILEVATARQDEVYVRFADIQSPEMLIAADIYCHKACKIAYFREHFENNSTCLFCEESLSNIHKKEVDDTSIKRILDVATANEDSELIMKICKHYNPNTATLECPVYTHTRCRNFYLAPTNPNVKEVLKKHVEPLIKDMLAREYYLTISDIREYAQEQSPLTNLYNYQVKAYLTSEFSAEIKFAKPYQNNKATIVYPSQISSEQLVARIQNFNRAKQVGELIRKKLLEVDFGLEDKFCDSADLKDAWENTRMPETLIEFFSGLLNVSKSDLINTSDDFGIAQTISENLFDDDSEDDSNQNEDEDDDMAEVTLVESIDDLPQAATLPTAPRAPRKSKTRKGKRKPKVLLAQSLFQTIFTAIWRGQKRAPLQVMAADFIHERTKSKTMMTCFNHLAFCISYPDHKRKKGLMAAYTKMKGKGSRATLPSHMSSGRQTIGSFDNFDNEDASSLSGTRSNHDTVTVIYQECNPDDQITRKPNISDCGDLLPHINMVEKLPCQQLVPYERPPNFKTLPLPETLKTGHPDPIYEDSRNSEILTLARTTPLPQVMLGGKLMPKPNMKEIPTWSGSNALTCQSKNQLYEVGFMPILPHPVTKHETVYTCLVNFNSLVDTLDQDAMAIVCDEGVYQYIMDIYCHNPKIFDKLFPMLGGFHLAKNALRCAGKYLRGSGIEDSLIEPGIFGPIVLESVLGGKHYYRSFAGLSIVEDAILQLRAEAFWDTNDASQFTGEIIMLANLQESLISWDAAESKMLLNDIVHNKTLEKLMDCMVKFADRCSRESEMCRYLQNYLLSMRLIKDFIRADRQADFLLHIEATKKLLPLFTGGDGMNYQRCGSFYYELLKELPSKHPELYLKMVAGGFVVKTNRGSFNYVAPDMKLEQSINRSAKSTHGIIGQTKCLNYVTTWQLLYHEMLAISNLFREKTCPSVEEDEETVVHHDLSKNKIKEICECVENVKLFIRDRGNPYNLDENTKSLKNISSQALAPSSVKEKILEFHVLSTDKFNIFHDAVYVKRSTLISETIHKYDLPRINYQIVKKSADSKEVKISKKEIKEAKRLVRIGAERAGGVESILKYDITPYNPLFERQSMAEVTGKSLLMTELEAAYLNAEHFQDIDRIPISTCVIVDFMSFQRSEVINASKTPKFGDLVSFQFQKMLASYPNTLLHVVFDSYISGSLKGAERERRAGDTIELAKIDKNTKILTQMEKFWGSSSNKVKMQQFFSEAASEIAKENNVNVVLSGTVIGKEAQPCKAIIDGQEYQDIELLKSSIEEADCRIVPHIDWSLTSMGYKNFVILSNDTDVLVLILTYFRHFKARGILKVWIRVGSGASKRHIPIHFLYERMPKPLVKVLLAAHVGTGCDTLSKIGTKLAALNAIPEMYLHGFGKGELSDEQTRKCEEYLVKVRKLTTDCKTFDALRVVEYKENDSVFDLPPTSHSIVEGHIPRWHYIVKEHLNLLNRSYVPRDPCDYQWVLDNEDLLPAKNLLLLPEEFSVTCSCKHKDVSRRCSGACKCSRKGVICSDLCACRKVCSNTQSATSHPSKRKQPIKKTRRTRQKTI